MNHPSLTLSVEFSVKFKRWTYLSFLLTMQDSIFGDIDPEVVLIELGPGFQSII